MRENSVPLEIFGPRCLYRWLFQHLYDLEPASKAALSELFRQVAAFPQLNRERLKELATVLEYEKALAALAPQDFNNFVEDALSYGEWPPGWTRPGMLLGSADLDIEPEALRQQLMFVFARDRIWPRQGFRSLIDEALDAVNQALDGLTSTGVTIALPRHIQGIQKVHDGIDRALLCAERILDLLVEFLSLVLLKLGLPPETVGGWMRLAQTWYNKQCTLCDKVCKAFWKDHQNMIFRDPPDSWQYHWNVLRDLVEQCGCRGELMTLLDQLRDYRNKVRHSAYTAGGSHGVPEVYVEATPGIRSVVKCLAEKIDQEPFVPQVARALAVSEDCYGSFEITLTLETRQLVIARYIHPVEKSVLAGQVEDGLALTQIEYEWFLFPSPAPEQHVIINPVLIRREYGVRDVGSVNIKEEVLSEAREEQLRLKEAPLEEVVEA